MRLIDLYRQLRFIFLKPTHLLLAAVLLCGAINFASAFSWGIPIASSPETVSPWPIDTIAPVKPLSEAYNKFQRDTEGWIVYPLFHYIVVDVAYAPYFVFQFLAGNIENPSGNFPYGVKNPEQFFHDLTVIARLVSFFMALGIVASIFFISRIIFNEKTGIIAALLTALIAPLAFYAKTSNLDVPYIFWAMLAIWQCLLAIHTYKLRHFILFGIFGALAIATKDQAYGFFVITPLIFAWYLAKQQGTVSAGSFGKALISKPIIVTGFSTVLTFCLANNLLFGGLEGYLQHLEFARTIHKEYVLVEYSDIYSLSWQLTLIAESFTLLLRMLGWPSLLLCIAGVAFSIYKRQWFALLLPIIVLAYYVFVIAPVGMVLTRYLILPAILLTPFAGQFVLQCVDKGKSGKTAILCALFIGICWQTFLSWNINQTLIHDSRLKMEAWIRANIPANTVFETQTQPRYLPRINDHYQYNLIANSQDAVHYELEFNELSESKLKERNPEYILLVKGIGVTGDPDAQTDPTAQQYYQHLLNGDYGYTVAAQFSTPTALKYKQVTSGTEPTTILLKKSDHETATN